MAVALDRGPLFWTPRMLTMGYIGLASVFALDVFGEGLGLWPTILALTMHLLPALVLAAVLVLAWHREWIGAVLFGALAANFVLGPLQPPAVRFRPAMVRLFIDVVVAGPVFLIAGLFLFEWLGRRRLDRPAGQ